jgi:hypothetical protein
MQERGSCIDLVYLSEETVPCNDPSHTGVRCPSVTRRCDDLARLVRGSGCGHRVLLFSGLPFQRFRFGLAGGARRKVPQAENIGETYGIVSFFGKHGE